MTAQGQSKGRASNSALVSEEYVLERELSSRTLNLTTHSNYTYVQDTAGILMPVDDMIKSGFIVSIT